jgi:hypothetical protein
MLTAREGELPHPRGWTDIMLCFEMSPAVGEELLRLARRSEVDIILVPLSVMEATKRAVEEDGCWQPALAKIRVYRMADRVTKTIHPDRFCV